MVKFDATAVREAWAKVPPAAANAIRYGWGRYISFLVAYIKREKLSGQVLGKYEGIYDLWGGNPKWRKKTGTLKRTFTARNVADLSAAFIETDYGAAWEHGFSRRQYTVTAKHLTPSGRPGYLVWFGQGKWNFKHSVTIPAQTFPAKPHVRPAIKETEDRLVNMVVKPMVRAIKGGASASAGTAYPFGAFGG